MGLIDLPTEIITSIADHPTEGEVAQLLPVNKYIHAQLSEYLLKRNARGDSLHALVWATMKPERRSVAQRLVQYGADLNARFGFQSAVWLLDDSTLLHFAVHTKCQSMVAALLELGANPFLVDVLGRTAMHWAHWNDEEEAIRCITDRITSPHKFLIDLSRGSVSLLESCLTGLLTLIAEYIKTGLDIRVKDCWDRSPLDLANLFLEQRSFSMHGDSAIHWVQSLVMLGEEPLLAYHRLSRSLADHESLPPTSSLDLDHLRTPPDISDLRKFPPLAHAPHQARSVSSTISNVWSAAWLARSAVKYPHAPSTQPHTATIQTTSRLSPLSTDKRTISKVAESSVTTWTTLRGQKMQVKSVEEDYTPTDRRAKRQWQTLAL